MGNNVIRALVLVLVVAGFSASTMTSAAAKRTAQNHESKTLVLSTGVVASPTPMCPPNQPDGCGIM